LIGASRPARLIQAVTRIPARQHNSNAVIVRTQKALPSASSHDRTESPTRVKLNCEVSTAPPYLAARTSSARCDGRSSRFPIGLPNPAPALSLRSPRWTCTTVRGPPPLSAKETLEKRHPLGSTSISLTRPERTQRKSRTDGWFFTRGRQQRLRQEAPVLTVHWASSAYNA